MSRIPKNTPEHVADLERELAQTKADLAASEDLNRRLERLVAQSRIEKFGRKSEKLNPDQYNLPFEDLEVMEGMLAAAGDAADRALKRPRKPRAPANRNKGNLPGHLERIEQVVEPETTLCPCGCGEMQRIGEDRTERLDIVPAQFRVLVTVRPKYICRTCDGKSHAQAPAPEHLVPCGLPTEGLVAHVAVAKFGDHLPFYRQAEIYGRQGLNLDRTMLGQWVGRAAHLLTPVIDAMIADLRRSDHLFADETTIPVLAPGTGKTRKDYLWTVLRDQRGWGGDDPPIVVFTHSQSRSSKNAQTLFKGYSTGHLCVDGYTGYDILGDPLRTQKPMELSYCWTHWRRRFVQYSRTTPSPICTEIIARIASLYRIEAEIRGKPPETRVAIRQELSKPIVDALHPWLEAQLQQLSSASELTKHIKYALKRWDGLSRFLSDGRVEMDTNPVENAIRPVPLTRKNALFAGTVEGARTWARMASLIGTCKINDINPQAYIEATLRKILNQHMQSDIQELMPWNLKT